MGEDEKKPQRDTHNEGYLPLEKGFTPTQSGKTIAQDGFTPTASGEADTPPQTVPDLTTSVQPPPKKDK